MNLRAVILGSALLACGPGALGCGGSDDAGAPAGSDAGGDTAVSDSASKYGKIAVKVGYTGTRKGQIALGVFTEPVPKTNPPVSFDTSKMPTFPYSATLSDLEPGRYWIVALLDFEPFSGASVKPGPEDISTTSKQIDLAAGDTQLVELTLSDAPADAGPMDASAD